MSRAAVTMKLSARSKMPPAPDELAELVALASEPLDVPTPEEYAVLAWDDKLRTIGVRLGVDAEIPPAGGAVGLGPSLVTSTGEWYSLASILEAILDRLDD